MKLAFNASPQALGWLLMGYGVITPCRQRPDVLSGFNSRSLLSQDLPKVIARPANGFMVLGLGLFLRFFASGSKTCSASTTASNSAITDYLNSLVISCQPMLARISRGK